MKKLLISLYTFIKLFGFDPLVLFNTLKGIPFYIKDYLELRKQKKNDKSFVFGKIYPILNERKNKSGIMSGHYFHQDLFIAREIFANKPIKHVDIGSRTDGFVAHVAVFREIEIIDIRDQKSKINNVKFRQADLMNLPTDMINYCDSISALHSIEHFGLGRYSDPIDYYGHEKAIENISLILKTEGVFYFAVPIGNQRIEFNAQRVFDIKYLLNLLEDKFKLKSFSYIDDNGDFFENEYMSDENIKTNFNCHYGCGIFELIKI